MQPPRSGAFAPVIAPLFVLASQGRIFEVIAFVVTFVIIFLLLLESLHPQVRFRKKPLPKPSISLNIDSPTN
jgi:hypothetical protein